MNHLFYFMSLLLSLALLSCQSDKAKIGIIVEGNIKLHNDWKPVIYISKFTHHSDIMSGGDQNVIDSAMIQDDGSFKWEFQSADTFPLIYRLNIIKKSDNSRAAMYVSLPNENYIHLTLQNGDYVKLSGDSEKLTRSFVFQQANASNIGYATLRNLRLEYLAKIEILKHEMDQKMRNHPENEAIIVSDAMKEVGSVATELQLKLKPFLDTINHINVGILASKYYLDVLEKEKFYPYIFSLLNDWETHREPNIYLKGFLEEINESISYFPVGARFPDIVLNNINGQETKLYEVNAKLILIDFWASWCGPCLAENRNFVKPLYKKYKANGFEVYGVSFDTNLSKWKSVVEKEGYNWIHVSDLKGISNSEIAEEFKVTEVPLTYLIDEQKNVIAKDIKNVELRSFLDAYFSK